ncbi:MAG: CRISPR-associated endoribonuclease Cas6 [Prolixibacteraceae bacterium]|jgi:CRISPR-associated endoribonuclease Cas6|nr:CRISPR-associated endoribonuclease Cas6 [Prolixibacteraceae bacterium]
MKFKITLKRKRQQKILPVDYQYYIGAWIYKVIGRADSGFASFLHSHGYKFGNKQFKLFCYSPLDFGRAKLWKEKSLFELDSETARLQVSFCLPYAAERFIIGLFNHQKVYIGDKFNGIDFTVGQIERLPEPAICETMKYRAKSAVVVSIKNENDKYAKYLSPNDENYSQLLKNNLQQKNEVFGSNTALLHNFDFKINNTPKSKLITVKPYTPQQSKIRGFVYDFTLTAPPEIHELILNSGLGEKNSTGFGWCEVKPPSPKGGVLKH